MIRIIKRKANQSSSGSDRPLALVSSEMCRTAGRKVECYTGVSFNVQLWTKDSDVRLFFGLQSDVYERWIDHPEGEPHPRHWTDEEREQIRKSFLRRLEPRYGFRRCGQHMRRKRRKTGFSLRTTIATLYAHCGKGIVIFLPGDSTPADPRCRNRLRRRWGHGSEIVILAPASFWRTSGTERRRSLTCSRDSFWKSTATVRKRDGFLSGSLCVDSPGPILMPAIFCVIASRNWDRPFPQWRELVDRKNVLVILDGMDEMTKTLSAGVVASSIDLLIDCCNREFEQVKKVIVTCRTPFFEELTRKHKCRGETGKTAHCLPTTVRQAAGI